MTELGILMAEGIRCTGLSAYPEKPSRPVAKAPARDLAHRGRDRLTGISNYPEYPDIVTSCGSLLKEKTQARGTDRHAGGAKLSARQVGTMCGASAGFVRSAQAETGDNSGGKSRCAQILKRVRLATSSCARTRLPSGSSRQRSARRDGRNDLLGPDDFARRGVARAPPPGELSYEEQPTASLIDRAGMPHTREGAAAVCHLTDEHILPNQRSRPLEWCAG